MQKIFSVGMLLASAWLANTVYNKYKRDKESKQDLTDIFRRHDKTMEDLKILEETYPPGPNQHWSPPLDRQIATWQGSKIDIKDRKNIDGREYWLLQN